MGLLVDTVRGKKTDHVPFWFMRQAGRYLPEYRELRSTQPDFFSCCLNPDVATEITLQPIRRYGMDAAIIFSDILVLPLAMGVDIHFSPGEGPVVKTETRHNILSGKPPEETILSPICGALQKVRKELDSTQDLIGFAGAPWTILCYLYGGKRHNDFEPARLALYQKENEVKELLSSITEATADYLIRQIETGATMVMLFDSWASTVPAAFHEKILIAPVKRICERIRETYPEIPLIAFPRGISEFHAEYIEKTTAEVIAIDQFTNMKQVASRLPDGITLQGNLDPLLLQSTPDNILRETDRILESMQGRKFIFNLGHGMVPETPPENVAILCKHLHGKKT